MAECSEFLMADGVRRLVSAGAEFLVIASNTAHLCVAQSRSEYPRLPILHIADITARAIRERGMTKIGLLGLWI